MIHKGKNIQQLHRAGYTLRNRSLDYAGQTAEVALLTSENETVRESDRRYDKRGEESKKEIPKPVTCSRECALLRSGASGERLPDEDPDATTLVS